MSIVTVLGAGVMGTALTFPLADNGHEVRLVGTHLDSEIIDQIRATRRHPGLGSPVPDSVQPFQIEQAPDAFAGAEVVVSGVNSFGVHWAGEKMAALLKAGMLVIAVTKGMQARENGDLVILPDVLAEEMPPDLRDRISWNAIAGPSIAGELAARRLTCVVFAGNHRPDLDRLAGIFRTGYYRIWTSTDIRGVELCAAMKNGYAIGVGLAEGTMGNLREAADRMHNHEAAIFAQATLELEELVALVGGEREAAYDLAGVGDLYVTATAGRNVRLGRLLGSGKTFEEARELMAGQTLEGAEAVRVVGSALAKLEARGLVAPNQFPMLRYLYGLITGVKPGPIPWDEFYARMESGAGRE